MRRSAKIRLAVYQGMHDAALIRIDLANEGFTPNLRPIDYGQLVIIENAQLTAQQKITGEHSAARERTRRHRLGLCCRHTITRGRRELCCAH